MLSSVKELQNKAVERLKTSVLSERKKTFTFKAPTGSGKTYMMAHFCDEILALYPHSVFIISSLSKGGLATQNYEKFEEYTEKGFFKHLDSCLIQTEVTSEEKIDIPLNHNVYFLPRDLYKKNSRLKERGDCLVQFIKNLKNKYSDDDYESEDFALSPENDKNKKLVFLIKDECHIATTNLDDLNKYFDKIINFSATPNLKRGQFPDVEITEEEAENVFLIKKVVWNDDENINFEKVLSKFIELKNQYLEMVDINPCLIVQISNKNKADEEVKAIKEVLSHHPSLKWMLIVDKEKDCDTNDSLKLSSLKSVSKWKDYAKQEISDIDVIIFKMVITEGYDIPRSCMLYQVRDTKSKTLDEQVVGRVRRNPKLLTFETLKEDAKELITKAYVYGVKGEERGKTKCIGLQSSKISTSLTFKTTVLKPLKENKEFNIKEFVENKVKSVHSYSIFNLHKKLKSVENSIEDLVYSYADDSEKWCKTIENLDEIENKSTEFCKDYEKSLEVLKDENEKEKTFTLPLSFIFDEKQVYTRTIESSVWRILGGSNNIYDFSFDSDSENEWAGILKSIEEKAECLTVMDRGLFESQKVYLWGKNYPFATSIKFPYYNNGIRDSYPDFIFKDKKGELHFFEVKGLDKSSSINIDTSEYEEKVSSLKKAYQATSKKLKGYNFYIPIRENGEWTIFKYTNGKESILSLTEFKESFKNI